MNDLLNNTTKQNNIEELFQHFLSILIEFLNAPPEY